MSLERLKGKLVSVAFKQVKFSGRKIGVGKLIFFFYCIDFYIF